MNKELYFENLKTYKFVANKSLGQNFLCSADIAEKIVSSLEISSDDNVLEIGAGLGSLSFFLTKTDAKITLIDVDENMINELNSRFNQCKNVNIARKNVLKADLSSYTKIIGNLPYYITSSIIEKILLEGVNAEKITLMVQKEVYQKLTDKKEVSPLSIFLNYVASISSSTLVGRNNFVPVPHVDSAYFVLTPNLNIKNEDNKALYSMISKLFLYRRKTILNNLTKLIGSKEKSQEILQECSIDLNLRPEQIDIDIYIKLLNNLKSKDFISKII